MDSNEKMAGFDAALRKSLDRPLLAPAVVKAIRAATRKRTLTELCCELEKLQDQQFLLALRVSAIAERRGVKV